MTTRKDFQNKRAMVTGTGSFIGSHLALNTVNAGHNIRAVVHCSFQNNWRGLIAINRK